MVLCTSTLAVGVNLPAHLVVVKGTQVWLGGISGFRDYTDIEIQQMIGRAGRPQYDRSATAVIMCDKRKEERFRDMAHSRTLVESCLYQNLVERESIKSSDLLSRLLIAIKHPDLQAENLGWLRIG